MVTKRSLIKMIEDEFPEETEDGVIVTVFIDDDGYTLLGNMDAKGVRIVLETVVEMLKAEEVLH